MLPGICILGVSCIYLSSRWINESEVMTIVLSVLKVKRYC